MAYIILIGGSPSAVNIVAITWSTFSIISSIFTFFTTKTIQRNNEYIVVSFEARNDSEDVNYKNARCSNNKIIAPLARVLNANVQLISVMKPELMGMGLKLKFIINTNSYMLSERGQVYKNDISNAYKIVNEYKTSMNDTQKLKKLIDTINKEWKLTNKETTICNVTVDFVTALKRNKSTIKIQLTDQMSNTQNVTDISPTSPALPTPTNGHDNTLSTDAFIITQNNDNITPNGEGIQPGMLKYMEDNNGYEGITPQMNTQE